MRFRALAVAAILAALSHAASATTWYIDGSLSASGNGSLATPWNYLAAPVGGSVSPGVRAGDTILVRNAAVFNGGTNSALAIDGPLSATAISHLGTGNNYRLATTAAAGSTSITLVGTVSYPASGFHMYDYSHPAAFKTVIQGINDTTISGTPVQTGGNTVITLSQPLQDTATANDVINVSNPVVWRGASCSSSCTTSALSWAPITFSGTPNWTASAVLPISVSTGNFTWQFQEDNTGCIPGTGCTHGTSGPLVVNPLYFVFSGFNVAATSQAPTTGGAACGKPQSSERAAVYPQHVTHLVFDHFDVGCSGGGGFQFTGASYMTVTNSKIHDNSELVSASTNANCSRGSGYSFLKPFDWDGDTTTTGTVTGTRAAKVSDGYVTEITNTVFWNNFNGLSTSAAVPGNTSTNYPNGCSPSYSDGEGIILDRTFGDCEGGCGSADGPNTTSNYPQYTGRILISNNVIVGSGGPAVHIYDGAAYVDIFNNSTWNNNSNQYHGGSNQGEVNINDYHPTSSLGGTLGIRVENNAMYSYGVTVGSSATPLPFSVTGSTCTACFITVKNNVMYNKASATRTTYQSGTETFTTANTLAFDPGFNSPNNTPTGDFRLANAPTTAQLMTAALGEFVSPDILGTARTSPMPAGAYVTPANGGTPPGPPAGVAGTGQIGTGCGILCAGTFKYLYLHQ